MRLKSLLWLAIVTYLSITISYVQAQPVTRNVYVLEQSTNDSTVFAIRISDGKQKDLFNVANTQRGILPQVFPQDELNALAHYLTAVQHDQWQISELDSHAVVQLIAASPDNQQIAIVVVYASCFVPQHSVCFSTTQIIIVDTASGQRKTILNLGSHNGEFIEANIDQPEVQVEAMEWMLDQKGLLLRINNRPSRRNLVNYPIIVVPIDGSSPFKIGEGLTWTVSADSKDIAILAYYTDDKSLGVGFPNMLHLIHLDLQTEQFAQSSYVLYPYYIGGIVYAGQQIIFQADLDTRSEEGYGGLGLLDTQTGKYSLVLPKQYFRQMQSTPDGSRLIFQNGDNTLSEAIVNGTTIATKPIISTPVRSWILGSDGQLLIQFSENGDYQILNRQNHQMQGFSVPDPMPNLVHSMLALRYTLIDW